ncbi:nucleotidyltransferase domain-containing protein [Candidatus Woesearchaeota archaeon]|nr:nucleotidyltransferase domain-containing protein [Candidatus Woesearchaeota archaeon]
MKAEIKILKLLISHTEEKFTIKKIAERAKINYRIAHENVSQMEKEGLIQVAKIGNTKICEFTNKFNKSVFEAEYERRWDLLKNKDFLVLHKRLFELQFPFIALLFGSHAKRKANKHSDIDLLTIGGDEKEIRSIISLWPEKIHLTLATYKEFIHMAKSKEFTVVSEAIKNNIILVGIEEYYRLMSNAQ